MTINKKNIRQVFLAFTTGLLFASFAVTSSAQSNVISEENTVLAASLSKTIIEENLLTDNTTSLEQFQLNNLPPKIKLRHIRQHALNTITLANSLNPQDVLSYYTATIESSGTSRDKKLYNIHKIFLENIDLSKPTYDTSTVSKALNRAINDDDWYVASNAWLLKSVITSHGGNRNIALQQAHRAQSLIPNEISPYVTDAKIETLVQIAMLNNLLLDPELAIENTAELIELKRIEGYPIDGSSLLNNLLYSLSKWREYEVSTQLAQTVLEIETKVDSKTPGLTELRVAQLYDRQGNFQESLKYSRLGLESAEIATLRKSLEYIEVNALAGLGNLDNAVQKLSSLRIETPSNTNLAASIRLQRAELGLAIAKNNPANTYIHLNKLLDLTAQNHLSSYNANTSKILADLENTKDRQAEREDALKREAVLKQTELDQQKQRNRLLAILASLLALAALCAILFARYRNKVSEELAVKTLEAEDADRMKSEFLGMVSHELRTPLNGIVGIADLLAMQAPSEDLRHKAGIILDSSNKLTHVIESIVDMSMIDGGKMELYPEPTDIHSIVMDLDKLWRPTLENKGVILTSFVEDSLADEIVLDKTRFRQCLNNLLSNAEKFTESGRVHLHVTSKLIPETGLTEVTAIVADTGQGISEVVQERLFTPFLQADNTMTRKHGGSGLGLSITQNIARMMGGDVTMVSNLGRGSEFVLTVRGKKSEAAQMLDDVEALMDQFDMTPVSTPTASQDEDVSLTTETLELVVPEAISKTSPDKLRGLKVLMVEDNIANQDVIKLFLNPKGCQVQCVTNGREALDVLNTQPIDIIIMDVRAPDMDGIASTRAIRSSGRVYNNTPIIALTADGSADVNALCMGAGANIFLTKPVIAKSLFEAIQFALQFQESAENISVNAA